MTRNKTSYTHCARAQASTQEKKNKEHEHLDRLISHRHLHTKHVHTHKDTPMSAEKQPGSTHHPRACLAIGAVHTDHVSLVPHQIPAHAHVHSQAKEQCTASTHILSPSLYRHIGTVNKKSSAHQSHTACPPPNNFCGPKQPSS